MTFARLCAHYFSHAAWLEPDELLRNCGRLAGIPGVLVHGRLDLGGPADVPWLLPRRGPVPSFISLAPATRAGPK